MQLIKRLLSLKRSHGGRNHQIRGLSTAELVGIIVIVGILGAIGGTYITGLVKAANKNSISQNLATLNTVYASATAAGVSSIPTTSDSAAITALNSGVTDSNGVTYQMSPAISSAAISADTYQLSASPNGIYTFVASTTSTTP